MSELGEHWIKQQELRIHSYTYLYSVIIPATHIGISSTHI